MELKDFLSPDIAAKLMSIKDEAIAKEQKEAEDKKAKHMEFLKKYGFKNTKEMLDYMKSTGHKIREYPSWYDEYLSYENGYVIEKYMVYNDIDMPIGYDKHIYSEEEFIYLYFYKIDGYIAYGYKSD